MIDEQKEMNHMRELVELLNRARRSYEQENIEIMSNYEYDKLYDELQELEEKLGTKLVISDKAQLCGALGAALFAADMADV